MSLLMEALKKAEKEKQERKKLEKGNSGHSDATPGSAFAGPASRSSFQEDPDVNAVDDAASGLEMQSDAPDSTETPDSSTDVSPLNDLPADFPTDPDGGPDISPEGDPVATETAASEKDPTQSEPADFRPTGVDEAIDTAAAATEDSDGGPAENQWNTRVHAENLFRAKQPVRPNRRRLFLWGAVVLVFVLIAAAQGYRLWQEKTRPNLIAMGATIYSPTAVSEQPADSASPHPSGAAGEADNPAGPAEAPADPKMAENLGAVVPATSSSLPQAPVVSAGDGRTGPAASARIIETVLPEPEFPENGIPSSRAPVPSPDSNSMEISVPRTATAITLAQPAARPSSPLPRSAVPGGGRVEIVRTHRPDPIDAQVASAYQAFLEKDFQTARLEYRKILGSDPDHRDALAGLAAIAITDGHPDEAGRIYARLLELNPRDALAQAGVLVYTSDTPESEARIKTLIDRQPTAPFLHFVLGTHYAAQSNWPAARQAFFNAIQFDPENPDYAFNLAVSLDHLRQSELAAENYQKALDFSTKHPSAFRQDIARARLQQLGEGGMP